MKEIFKKFLSSLDNHSFGFSARKLSAMAVILVVLVAHACWIYSCIKKDNWSQLEMVLTIDYSFIGLCLGLTTYQQIKKPIDGSTNSPANP